MTEEFKEPESTENLFYFTDRDIGNGRAFCWVEKLICPKCGKARMGKPRDKSGKIKVRAKEYVCPNCGYSEEKSEYESKLVAKVIYKCPHCGYEGKLKLPFKRKKIKGIETFRFLCDACNKPIDITKKFKNKK